MILEMGNPLNNAEKTTMFRLERPRSKEHVLHRQPRLSSLVKQRELTEKAVALWTSKTRQHKTKDVDGGQVARSPAMDTETPGIHGVVKKYGPLNTSRQGETKPPTLGRPSHEWETETLLDYHSPRLGHMTMYPCPFRKRNPVRFNVREHEACAKAPFESVAAMIRHVLTHHRRRVNSHQCRRCKETFETGPELERHLLVPRDEICDVAADDEQDLEDGLMEEMVKALAAMSLSLAEEMWTWESTWAVIFPDDVEIPAPEFDPVTELVEVEQVFDEEQDALKKSLREKLHLLLPKDLGTDYLNFLAGQLELVFETHRVNVMKKTTSRCRSPASVDSPSGTPRTERPNSPKKENRKSRRRSTMLQNLLQRGTQDETSPGLDSPRNLRLARTARTSTRFSTTSFLLRTPRTPKDTSTETTQDESPPSGTTTPSTEEYETNVSSPRDSRDSGIGMPCDTCDSEGDACACHEPFSSSHNHLNKLNDLTASYSATDLSPPASASAIPHPANTPTEMDPAEDSAPLPDPAGDGPSSRHNTFNTLVLPRLRTANLSSTSYRTAASANTEYHFRSASPANEPLDGPFSPESFKQRVLRRQLMSA